MVGERMQQKVPFKPYNSWTKYWTILTQRQGLNFWLNDYEGPLRIVILWGSKSGPSENEKRFKATQVESSSHLPEVKLGYALIASKVPLRSGPRENESNR